MLGLAFSHTWELVVTDQRKATDRVWIIVNGCHPMHLLLSDWHLLQWVGSRLWTLLKLSRRVSKDGSITGQPSCKGFMTVVGHDQPLEGFAGLTLPLSLV